MSRRERWGAMAEFIGGAACMALLLLWVLILAVAWQIPEDDGDD